jgi:hypothetical protein
MVKGLSKRRGNNSRYKIRLFPLFSVHNDEGTNQWRSTMIEQIYGQSSTKDIFSDGGVIFVSQSITYRYPKKQLVEIMIEFRKKGHVTWKTALNNKTIY